MRKPAAASISEMCLARRSSRLAIFGVLLGCSWAVVFVAGARAANLRVGFEPARAGASTTLDFAFDVGGAKNVSPLTSVALHFPPVISYATSALGTAECDATALVDGGLKACPTNSRIGSGTALVRVPFGGASLRETVRLTLLVGRTEGETIEVLYYAIGTTPVISQLVFRGELGSAASGGGMLTKIPPIATLPGAPNASVINLRSRIDPPGLSYTATSHGKTVRYHPRGIILPATCPTEGFAFSATFRFENHSSSRARSVATCQP
jgi:hypothetical protein